MSCGTNGRCSLLFWLAVVTLLAFALRVVRLGFQPLWWDEGWSVYFATADVPTMIARTAVDIHPPFYYLLLHGWVLAAGASASSVRLFSVLVGTLSIPLFFLLGDRLFGPKVGILAALVMALAPFHVYYSQETRMYGLVTLLVVASMSLFVSIMRKEPGKSSSTVPWVLYVLVTSLAMYTQYYAAFIPLSQSIFVFIRIKRHRHLVVKWLAAQFALLVAFVPWLLYAGGKLVQYVATKLVKESDVPIGLPAYVREHVLAFALGHLSEGRALLSWAALIIVALAVLGIVGYVRRRPQAEDVDWRPIHGITLSVIYLALPLFLGYVVNLRYPFTSPGIQRLFLLSAPAFYLLVALGLSWLGERFHLLWLGCLALVAINSLALYDFYTVERYATEDYRPLVEEVQAAVRPDDVVVAVHPWQIGYFHAYLSGQLPTLYLTPKEAADVTSEVWAQDPDLMAEELSRLLVEHRFLWLPTHQTLGRILENDMEGYLAQTYYPLFSQWFSESTKLSCYAASQELPLTGEETDFGAKISLLGYGLSSGPVEAGWGALPVELHWRINGQLEGRYKIAFRLTEENGRVWASQDSEPVVGLRAFHEQPVGSEITDRHALLVPAGTPPGAYELRLGLYRLQDEQWLDILDESGSPQGVEVVLGPVDIVAPQSPPPLTSLRIDHPRQADFAAGLRLLGYSGASEKSRPGEVVEVTLFWQVLDEMSEDYRVSLQLQDREGRVWASAEGSPGRADHPTSLWRQGELARDPHSLLIPARAPGAEYRLLLRLTGPGDGQPVPLHRWGLNWGDSVALGSVSVEGRVHQMEPPAAIERTRVARLGDLVGFLGYDLDRQQVSAGESLQLTLYWQALSETDTSYTVFTHLIDGQGHIWGQQDSVPGHGSLPTSSWLTGEYIVDRYDIQVRSDAPPGEYLIELGMYEPATMIRLSVFDAQGAGAGDRILLDDAPIHVGP